MSEENPGVDSCGVIGALAALIGIVETEWAI
jgi:hypothetical protein